MRRIGPLFHFHFLPGSELKLTGDNYILTGLHAVLENDEIALRLAALYLPEVES